MTLTVGSLFSGIGGLDLGLERAGMEIRWQSEINPYCCRVLAKHWPHVPNLGDVTKIDWSSVERVDLVAGGFPCQPVSQAGKRQAQADARWLWPEMLRAVRCLRPRFVLVENVPGLLARTGAMGDVLGDLAQCGLDARWDLVPAAAFGAPHLRYRLWLVAYPVGVKLRLEPTGLPWGQGAPEPGDDGASSSLAYAPPLPDADGERQLQPQGRLGEVWRRLGDGGGHWTSEPDVGRVAHGVPARLDRLRALGNAVVPQVAEWIGRRIMEAAA